MSEAITPTPMTPAECIAALSAAPHEWRRKHGESAIIAAKRLLSSVNGDLLARLSAAEAEADRLHQALMDEAEGKGGVKNYVHELTNKGFHAEATLEHPFTFLVADIIGDFFDKAGGCNFVTVTVNCQHTKAPGFYVVTIQRESSNFGPAEKIGRLDSALRRIVALADEWDSNKLGDRQTQRLRWQRLGAIARAALEDA